MYTINTLVFLVSLVALCCSMKIAVIPFLNDGSHLMVMHKLAVELDSRGHQIVFILANSYNETKYGSFDHVTYTARTLEKVEDFANDPSKLFKKPDMFGLVNFIMEVSELAFRSILKSGESMKAINGSDLILTESVNMYAPLLSAIFNKPRVDLSSMYFSQMAHIFRIPKFSNEIPSFFSQFTAEMSYSERLINHLITLTETLLYEGYNLRKMASIKNEFDIYPDQSIMELYHTTTSAVLISGDFSIEYAQPLPEFIHFIGPIMPRPPSALPLELEEYITGNDDHGAIIVSFGTYTAGGRNDTWDEMIKALGSLKQRIIWKTKLKYQDLPSNIKTVPWMPQNDLLGHPSTKAFITHCGHKSAYEAGYHGVPIIGVPIFGDQHAKASRFANKGKMAVILNPTTAKVHDWMSAINEVLYNPWLKGNASRVSKLLRSHPESAATRAALIIERIEKMDYDVTHLHSKGIDLPYFIYAEFDVLATLYIIISIILFITVKILGKVISKILARVSKSRNEKCKED